MDNGKIEIEWVKGNRKYEKEVNQEDCLKFMNELKKDFGEKDEVFKWLISEIPQIFLIKVDFDMVIFKKAPVIKYKKMAKL